MEVGVRIIDTMARRDESYSTYSKQPDWARYQIKNKSEKNWSTTMDQQKNMIKIWLSQFCCELQLKPVHWPTHSLLALASLQGSEHLLSSTEVLAIQSIVEILLMDKALHQFDMANEYTNIYIQIYTGLPWTVSSTASSHPTCHPDPTADAPMPLSLAPSWHSFRGFGPPDLGAKRHVAANAVSCTRGSLWPNAAKV